MLGWLVSSIINSISIGSLYFVISVGLTLTLAVIKLPNFAHAEFLTIGAYVGIIISAIFPNNFVIVAVAAFSICGAIALIIHYIVFRPLLNRKVSTYILVLASFAAAQFVRYGVFSGASIGDILASSPSLNLVPVASFANATVTNVNLISVGLTVSIAVLLGLFLNLTIIGKSMRAVASNPDLAKLTGVNIVLVINVMWIIAGGLAGVGGVVFSVTTNVTPVLGLNVLLDIFSVVIIAGLTSIAGTVIGAYIVAFAENTFMAFLNQYFAVPFSYAPVMPFVLIVIILLFKPTGLAPNSNMLLDLRNQFLRRFLKR